VTTARRAEAEGEAGNQRHGRIVQINISPGYVRVLSEGLIRQGDSVRLVNPAPG
jgi:MOSC domain-containing protein YiiM